jgi:hypothetical protein
MVAIGHPGPAQRRQQERKQMAKRPASNGDTPNEDANDGGVRTESITIAGTSFTVPSPFTEGHVLTAGEASQLNQVFHENIRNNFSKKVKAGTATQADIDAYAASYKMGVRTGGGRVSDPVRREALRIVTDKIVAQLRSRGDKVGGKDGYSMTDIRAKAVAVVDSKPEYMETARRNLETAKAAGEIEL